MWPTDADALVAYQKQLALVAPDPVAVDPSGALVGACWVCFPRGLAGPGTDQDPAWCAAVLMCGEVVLEHRIITAVAGGPYAAGLMALRTGRLLEEAVGALSGRPDVVLLDATARDHPRGAGLALHLGAELDVATIGVTHRPLVARGEWPTDQRNAMSPLRIGDSVVGCWLRTQPGVRPLAVHPGWRIDLATAAAVVTGTSRRRTPEPLRRAREFARRARTQGAPEHSLGSPN